MQIRVRGRRLEFLRSEYLPGKKRSTQKLLGSMDAYGYATVIPQALREKMTEEEIAQVEAYFQKEREDREARSVRYALTSAGASLREMARAIEEQEVIAPEKAAEVYAGLDQVAKALRKKGFARAKIRAEQKGP